MRYELGDTINLTFTPPLAPPADGSAPTSVKTDQRAKYLGFDSGTGVSTFDVPASDPTLENPLIGIIAVFVPVGHGVPSTAQGFIDLPESDYPRTKVDLDSSQFGAPVQLPPPSNLLPSTPYLGQAIHCYAE